MKVNPGILAATLVAVVAARAFAQQFTVPLMKQAPKIDGFIDPNEWAVSAGFDGFHYDGKLQQRRVQAFVAATEGELYFAIKSQLPNEGGLAAEVKTDSPKAVYDDAVEVFVNPTPDEPRQVNYQFLANSLGKGGYTVHTLGGAEEDVAWQGGWRHAGALHEGWWHFECAVPVESMGIVKKGRKTTDGLWKINLTRDWKNPWEWSSLSGEGGAYAFKGYVFRFTKDPAPAARYAASSDPFLANFEGVLSLHNPSGQALDLSALLVLERNNMPAIREEQKLSLAGGASKELKLKVPAEDPTTHYSLSILVRSADGKTTFYERKTAWPRGKPYVWVAGRKKEAPPLDFRFACYPYLNRMRLLADINGLPKDAALRGLWAVIRAAKDKKEVKAVEFPVDRFRDGRQELGFELPPVEGEYEIAMKAEGRNVPPGEIVQTFERKVFPWEHTKLGTSTKVYPPFTPIEVDGRKLRTVLREHVLNDVGLLDQVTATSAQTGVSKPILASPMRFVVKLDGKDTPIEPGRFSILSAKPHEVKTRSTFSAGTLRASIEGTWDYDGCLRVDLTIPAVGEAKLDELTLEIPLSAETAMMIHANADRIRAPVAQKLPAGEGLIWEANKVACDDYPRNFCPYVYVGDAVRGLCWFAENDKGWGWNPATPNVDIIRKGGVATIRVHLVNRPTVINGDRKITFGLLAAPVKPRLSPGGRNSWRYRYYRDHYTLLGTDINWLALGDCGSVYPAGRETYFWEMIAKGNKEKLDARQVQEAIDRGRKYFEPYGQERVKAWEAHVRHNLTGRYGAKMVFYYNRASCQLFEEFETFKDEWMLTDLRSVGKGSGIGEIKIVPSPSYIDHALYWYAKSFEVGGNLGVYWDNFFIAPSFNTTMTDAYAAKDGTIVPAAGMWALRDLCKRTFVMMNERGMPPITFPHMTSFNPLPMMSFATVQYDWEWKYSEGDVQDRFTRELILLMSNGDLAGVWPVPLSDHGKQETDVWTQRTFTAVRLVHELDGEGGFPRYGPAAVNGKLADSILKTLDEPGLDVYRYWDERPQPVVSDNADAPTIVYSVPGKQAVVAVASYSRKDEQVALKVDLKALGLDASCKVVDAETGQELPLQDGKVGFLLKKHDVRVLLLTGEAGR